jgi:phosphoribosylformylglycinamidine synthase PurS subunit
MNGHKVLLIISYKSSARDPEGETITHELKNLGYEKVLGVRAGKAFLFEVDSRDNQEAIDIVKRIASETRLYNPVVHDIMVIKVG